MPITAKQRERRRRHLGASDMPAILGVSPWANAADVYYSKVKTPWYDGTENKAQTVGSYLEPALLDWAESQLGFKGRRNQQRVCQSNPIFAASLDELVPAEDCVIEAKVSTVPDEWGEEGTDEVPDHVQVQVQAQMLVVGVAIVWVPMLLMVRPAQFRMYRVLRDPDLIGDIYEAGVNLWVHHIIPHMPPPNSVPSIEVLKRIKRVPDMVVPMPESLIEELESWRSQRLSIKKWEDACYARVVAALGDAEAGQYNEHIVTYFEQIARRFNQKRFRQDHPKLADEYTDTSAHRVLRYRKEKSLCLPEPDSPPQLPAPAP